MGALVKRAWVSSMVGFLWMACGGEVTFESSPEDTSSQTTTSTTSAGGTTTTSTTTTSASGGSGGAPSICDGLAEAACMAAYPDCAPAYDDACCPQCDSMGECADCSDYEFHHCGPLVETCNPPELPCYTWESWGCSGGVAPCPAITDRGGEYACDQMPGCVVAECSPELPCIGKQCHPVTGDSCTALCNSLPPACPPGLVAEADGSCYTGFCIPAVTCGVP
ncbi:MAG TPA: hypothetical protein VFB62_26590 [Polyangiaceae bacterium]|nr:hypothetical protein [Polyangiaceae bacterium]